MAFSILPHAGGNSTVEALNVRVLHFTCRFSRVAKKDD
jgi:hypothetical protein